MRNRTSASGLGAALCGVILQITFYVVFAWGETGGIWHSFAHYGTTDGLVSVFVPPYAWYRGLEFFAWQRRGGLTVADREELSHFARSLRLDQEAITLIEQAMASGTRSADGIIVRTAPEKDAEIERRIHEALRESQNVRDKVLGKVHPDLPAHYRNEFCEGTRLFARGYEGDIRSAVVGYQLRNQWCDWYNAHVSELKKAWW